MRFLELIPPRWLEWQPPSDCRVDFGIGEALAAGSALFGGEAAAGTGAAAVLGGAGETALIASAGLPVGVAAGLPAAAATAGAGSGLLSTVGTVASLGGSLLSANAASRNAAYQQQIAQSEATALNQKGNADAAAGQRQAITQDRQTQLVLSRLAASSAASGGGGTTDNSDERIAGNIAQQGSYNAASSLYEGQSRAASDQYQAAIQLFKGQQAAAAAPMAEAAPILSGISSFATNRAQMRYNTTTGTVPYSGF